MAAVFAASMVILAASAPAQAQEQAEESTYICFTVLGKNPADDTNSHVKYAIVTTSLPSAEVNRQWVEVAGAGPYNYYACQNYGDLQNAQQAFQHSRSSYWRQTDPVNFTPKAVPPVLSNRRRATVRLPSPDPIKGQQRGFGGLVFDVEYGFLACFGELHIAYSLVEDSVRPAPGGTMAPAYLLDGTYHVPSARPTQIISVPITGTVGDRYRKLIGEFGDGAAAKALGWGCFSGQSKKLGMMKDYVPANASEAQVAEFLNSLEAHMETTEIYESAAAEDEIRTFVRENPGAGPLNRANRSRAADMARDQARQRAEAEARARDEAEALARAETEARRRADAEQLAAAEAGAALVMRFKEEQAQYERDMAAHRAELDRIAAETARVEAEAARARAAHEAQMADHRRQMAEYEAAVVAQGRSRR